MGIPKKKNNINVYENKLNTTGRDVTNNRQKLLDRITKSDTYLPDSIMHDDLDVGMLDFIKNNFVIVSDGEQIPVLPKILTIQRWSEIKANWSFSDEDGNIKLPFIAVVRKPDVQVGTHPQGQRNIPVQKTFHYATVQTWNGTQMGADIYKIPQPIAIDLTYEIVIVCNKFRELNKMNKVAMQLFSSRQAYTSIKGHYIPILLENISDNSPIDSIDGRRFYLQTYTMILLGLLLDSDEFEVKPAMNRFLMMTELADTQKFEKKVINKNLNIKVVNIVSVGNQLTYSVGEAMTELFHVAINGLKQEKDIDYYHVIGTSKITFVTAPLESSVITITYYKNKSLLLTDSFGKVLNYTTDNFIYEGTSLTFTTTFSISTVITLDINGLIETEGADGYLVTGTKNVTLNYEPVIGSRIGISYLY